MLVWLLQRQSPGRRGLIALMAGIFAIDVLFCIANLMKLTGGGWVPLATGAALFLLMNTWLNGRLVVARQIARERRSVSDLKDRLSGPEPPARVPGTAVFMASNPDGLPRALWQNLMHNNVLHERVILLTLLTEEIPRVPISQSLQISEILPGIIRIVARSGFMETPDVTAVLREANRRGVRYDPADTTFFVGTESVFYGRSPLRGWEKRLFAFLMRNARRAASFYGVPEHRLVELGSRLGV
jgi:KUP system potassium uptake protein